MAEVEEGHERAEGARRFAREAVETKLRVEG
jgi:hypothetical protein